MFDSFMVVFLRNLMYIIVTPCIMISQPLIQTALAEDHIITIAYESSGEPFLAQTYVAKAIQNRMRERGKSASAVCREPYQFSCWLPEVRGKLKTRRDYELASARRAWAAAKDLDSPVNMFHDVSSTPSWTKSSSVTFLLQVGDMRFYHERR